MQLPEPPPVPAAATLSAGTLLLTVTFDRLLTNAALAPGNWTAIANIGPGTRNWIPAVAVAAAGTDVTWQAQDAGASLPGSNVDYSPPPFDLLGFLGAPAAGFSGFPLTVIP